MDKMDACFDCSLNCLLMHGKSLDHSTIVSSFFKVMYGKHFSKLLFVPPKFTRRLTSLVGKKTYLEDSSGRKWNVVLSNVNGTLAFHKGWYDFATDHGIKVGDFVVFHYITGSHFFVQIYGRSGCENTISGDKSYHNKRTKTDRDTVPQNGHYDSFDKEPAMQDNSTPCAVSEPDIDVIPLRTEVHNVKKSPLVVGTAPNPENIPQRQKVGPSLDFQVDPCFMINRDTSLGREDDIILDLSTFEMPTKKEVADKTTLALEMPMKKEVADKTIELQLQENVHFQVPGTGTSVKLEAGAAPINVKSQLAEGSSLSKSAQVFSMKMEYTPPSNCLTADRPLSSNINIAQTPISMPHISEFSAATTYHLRSDGRTRVVKQEPMEFSRNLGGDADADTSIAVAGHNVNSAISKETKMNNGELFETSNHIVRQNGDSNITVKLEPVDHCGSLSASPVTKITCLVQPGSECFLELSEGLPLKLHRRGPWSEKLVFLQDPVRRRWPVVYHQRLGLKVLSTGWKEFSQANSIQPGNECTFVAEDIDEAVFAVRIHHS